MDVNILIRYMMVCIATCVAAKESASRTDDAVSSIEVILKGRRTKSKHTSKTDGSLAIEENKTTQSCCYNGGICIMNAFCHCKKNFYGRRCEHSQRHRSCGTIGHGTWMAVACHLCHCFDGQITCKISTIKDCDNMSYTEGKETEPDYNVGMDKKLEDYDQFYDDGDSAQLKSSSGLLRDSSSIILMLVAILYSVVNVGS